MFRFIKKCSIFLIILAIIVGFVNNKYKETNAYKGKNSTEKFLNVPYNIDVANLGTSHAQYGFIYDELDLTGFNFALSAQRLYYDEKILKKYIDHFHKGSVVIIPISYITFYLGYEGENFEQFNKMYYSLLDVRDIKNFKLSEYIKFGLLPVLTAESNIEYLYKEEKPLHKGPTNNFTISTEKMGKDGLDTAKRHIEFIREGQKNKKEFISILEEIIDTCIENGLTPVLTTTPFTDYYNKHFSKEFYEEFYADIQGVLDKYPSLKYYDYSKDERFVNNPELFFDSSHLNLKGSKLFTEIILKDIEGCSGDGSNNAMRTVRFAWTRRKSCLFLSLFNRNDVGL